MLTEKTGSCDMASGFRLTVNPLNQGAIFEAQGTTLYKGTIVCSNSKEEIEQYCVDNGIELPVEEDVV